jgi:hypothetical protein
MDIDQLLEMWSEDASIDEAELNAELARVPSIHAKYLKIRTQHNLLSKKIQFQYTEKRKIKADYYLGHLNNPEDLEKHNVQPLLRKIDKSSLNAHLDTDEELVKILIKKTIHDEIVDTCDSILKEINNRTYQLGNLVKWKIHLDGS